MAQPLQNAQSRVESSCQCRGVVTEGKSNKVLNQWMHHLSRKVTKEMLQVLHRRIDPYNVTLVLEIRVSWNEPNLITALDLLPS